MKLLSRPIPSTSVSRPWRPRRLPLTVATILPERPSRSHAQQLRAFHRVASYSTSILDQGTQTPALPHGPLRILFCGSDDFSAVALRALDQERAKNPELIKSIDVLYRPAKRTGRGLKELTFPAIHDVAQALPGIRKVHHIDSFKVWNQYPDKPTDINMVIAVSFGLLIPARLIEGASYGGLNVHPSMLPDLPGAAPVHRALLNQRTHTGVTVQTLHPSKFDAGTRLRQTSFPGIVIPKNVTADGLISMLAEEGTGLLLDCLRSGSFVDAQSQRLPDFTPDQIDLVTDGQGLAKAPKFNKADSRIDWSLESAESILLKLRTFGGVWAEMPDHPLVNPAEPKSWSDHLPSRAVQSQYKDQSAQGSATGSDEKQPQTLRILYDDIVELHGSTLGGELSSITKTPKDCSEDECFPMKTQDGKTLSVRSCTVAGGKKGAGVKDLKKLAERAKRHFERHSNKGVETPL